jgi:cyclin-dependent kinase
MGCGNYSTKMDMWAVGCVFFEMVVRRHPFPGTDEKNQLELVFGLFGTPSEKSWPALSHSKDFKLNDFQPQKKRPLKMFAPSLCSNGLDLMASFFKLNPEKRISAEKALKHPYFDDYKALRTIPVKS